jgi:hypothetical protein
MTQLSEPATSSGRFSWRKLQRNTSQRIVLILAISATCLAQSSTPVDKTKIDPAGYLNFALDYIQVHAFRRTGVDWARIREQALARAPRPQSTVETYDAIRFALTGLGDHRSSFLLTPALENLESQLGRKPATNVARRAPRSGPYSARSSPEGRVVKAGGKVFALVVVSKCSCDDASQSTEYATGLQRIIAELDQSHPSGWIIDLRGNAGESMWPMLAGIGPVLGESARVGESFATQSHFAWSYRNGTASENGGKAKSSGSVQGAPYKLAETPRVAVLIDGTTGFGGEGVAIAFRGRANSRFFGEHTAGFSSITETTLLADGASLTLVTGVQADRTGKLYFDGLDPDELVPAATKLLPDDRDEVLQQALWWLSMTN